MLPRASGCDGSHVMLDFLKKIIGDSNERKLKKLWPVVDEINAHFETLQALSEEELRGKTPVFKQRIREAVADIEAEMAAIKKRLRGVVEEDTISGDGQVAEVEHLTQNARTSTTASTTWNRTGSTRSRMCLRRSSRKPLPWSRKSASG